MIMRTDDGSEKPLYSFGASDLEEMEDLDCAQFKQLQLEMRQLEMKETYQVLKEINKAKGDEIFGASSRDEGEDLESWKGRLDLDSLTVGGHLFGTTLALRTLKGAPSVQLPAKGAIVLDPGKSSGSLNHEADVPTLVIHSDSWSRKVTFFTEWPHFDVSRDWLRELSSGQGRLIHDFCRHIASFGDGCSSDRAIDAELDDWSYN